MDKGGERENFRKLTYGHYERLYKFAFLRLRNREDALDAVQETYLRAYRSISTLLCDEKVGQWLTRILLNVLRDYCRSRKGEPSTLPLPDEYELADLREMPHQLDRDELSTPLMEALTRLPDGFVSAILLREIGDYSYKEIAKLLDIPIGTVMSRIARARRILRDDLSRSRAARYSKAQVRGDTAISQERESNE